MTVSIQAHIVIKADHPGLSKDTVDALRKKVEVRNKKIESLRSALKPNWEVEVDKLVSGQFSLSIPETTN
jgi:hypothetical protein